MQRSKRLHAPQHIFRSIITIDAYQFFRNYEISPSVVLTMAVMALLVVALILLAFFLGNKRPRSRADGA